MTKLKASHSTPAHPRHYNVISNVLVVVKRTSYRTLVEEKHDARITDLIAAGDPTVLRMRRSHEEHEGAVAEVEHALRELGVPTQVHYGARAKVEKHVGLVVTVGGDGTLLAASHQVDSHIPVLGVNSAPSSSVGFFCATKKGAIRAALEQAVTGRMIATQLTRMSVDLNGSCIHNRVLNEALFCHSCPAATSRYILRVTSKDGAAVEEEQRSSGMWVGPAAGSTAAQKSAGGRVLPLLSSRIQYVVREPYTPHGHALKLAVGTFDAESTLTVRNKMTSARLFLDGDHVGVETAIGDVLTMRRSDEPLTVLGLTRNRT